MQITYINLHLTHKFSFWNCMPMPWKHCKSLNLTTLFLSKLDEFQYLLVNMALNYVSYWPIYFKTCALQRSHFHINAIITGQGALLTRLPSYSDVFLYKGGINLILSLRVCHAPPYKYRKLFIVHPHTAVKSSPAETPTYNTTRDLSQKCITRYDIWTSHLGSVFMNVLI